MAARVEVIICTRKCWCAECKGQIDFGVKFLRILTVGSWRRRINLCPDCVVNFGESLNQDSIYRLPKREVSKNDRRD